MEQRIRDFELIWNETNLIGILPPCLLRQTNEHHLLSDAALAQWWKADNEGRAAIMEEHLPERRPENNAVFEFAPEFDSLPDQDFDQDPLGYPPIDDYDDPRDLD